MGEGNNCRKFPILFIFTFFAFILLESPSFPATGVILTVKGKVSIKSHDAISPAKTGLRLEPGDMVSSLGGTASIILSDGKMHVVKEGSSFILPPDTAEGSRDTLVTRLMDTIRDMAHRGRGPTVKAMVRGEGEVMLIYPFNSSITSNKLRFEWEGIEGVEGVDVFLKTPSPAYRYSFQVDPGKNKALLPKDAPALLPDIRYYWKVKGSGKVPMEPLSSKLCWFSILGQEKAGTLKVEMNRIDSMGDLDENSRDFLKAILLTSYGLHHQAASILKRMLQQSPEDQGTKEVLLGVFMKMKNFEEAARYR